MESVYGNVLIVGTYDNNCSIIRPQLFSDPDEIRIHKSTNDIDSK